MYKEVSFLCKNVKKLGELPHVARPNEVGIYFLVSEEGISLHCFVHFFAHVLNDRVVFGSFQYRIDHFYDLEHEVFFGTTSCDGRSAEAYSRSLER